MGRHCYVESYQNTQNRQIIARPGVRDMGYILRVHCLPLLLQFCMWYRDILQHAKTTTVCGSSLEMTHNAESMCKWWRQRNIYFFNMCYLMSCCYRDQGDKVCVIEKHASMGKFRDGQHITLGQYLVQKRHKIYRPSLCWILYIPKLCKTVNLFQNNDNRLAWKCELWGVFVSMISDPTPTFVVTALYSISFYIGQGNHCTIP